MALQASGQISMNDMNVECGNTPTAQIDLGISGLDYGIEFNTDGTNSLQFTEFYSLECGGGGEFFTWPYNVNSFQADEAGEFVQTTWQHANNLGFTLLSYTVWIKVNTGSWNVLTDSIGTSSTATAFLDVNTQPGNDIYTRVQAIGSSQKSPPDTDMDNTGTTYPETALTVTEDNTPTE